MITCVEYDRGWMGARAMGFAVVWLLELLLCTVGCLAPFLCAPVLMALEPVGDALRLPVLDPVTDLREFYPAAADQW